MQCRKSPCMCCLHSSHGENGRRRRGIALCAPQTAESGQVAICHHLPFKRLHVTAYSSLDELPKAATSCPPRRSNIAHKRHRISFWYSCQTVVNNFAPHYRTCHLSLPAFDQLGDDRSMVPKARCGRTGSSSIPQSHFRRTFTSPHTRVSAPVVAASDSPARLAVACSHRPPPLNYSAICTCAAVSRHGQVCGRRRAGPPCPDWCEFIRSCAAQK